jgi:transcriptional regulator GlxA family with amidase domain
LTRPAARLVSVCTGAFLLAEAGLLDGRRVATHWAYCDALAARWPRPVTKG